MASALFRKITALLRSPQGSHVVEQVRKAANRPENRRRIAALLRRLGRSRRY